MPENNLEVLLSAEQIASRVKELAARLAQLLQQRDAQMPTDKLTGNPIEWPDHPKDNHSK